MREQIPQPRVWFVGKGFPKRHHEARLPIPASPESSTTWPSRVFLGPYWRRPDLVDHVKGFFFNPANQPDLNYPPLATAAAWCGWCSETSGG